MKQVKVYIPIGAPNVVIYEAIAKAEDYNDEYMERKYEPIQIPNMKLYEGQKDTKFKKFGSVLMGAIIKTGKTELYNILHP